MLAQFLREFPVITWNTLVQVNESLVLSWLQLHVTVTKQTTSIFMAKVSRLVNLSLYGVFVVANLETWRNFHSALLLQ